MGDRQSLGGGSMLYVALGDSVTFGYSATRVEQSFVRRLQRFWTRPQRPVHVYLQAKPGWTSKQLLRSLADVQDSVFAEAKVTTLMIGGNDLLRGAPWLINGNHARMLKIAEQLNDHVQQIVQHVRTLGPQMMIATLYNPFPQSLLAVEYTQIVNRLVRRVAHRNGLLLADVAQAFEGREQEWIEGYRLGRMKDFRLIGNPVHPNNAGHAAIAQVFIRAWRQAHPQVQKDRRQTSKLRTRRLAPRASDAAAD
ncbi:SGNH/GDSL hydrolase family protein [Alicyclobacillaceae bacterium I2511]|nr:SGNH/GDSL hydrolase family protein [Alicyclobacillaceae bacterium I2511]